MSNFKRALRVITGSRNCFQKMETIKIRTNTGKVCINVYTLRKRALAALVFGVEMNGDGTNASCDF